MLHEQTVTLQDPDGSFDFSLALYDCKKGRVRCATYADLQSKEVRDWLVKLLGLVGLMDKEDVLTMKAAGAYVARESGRWRLYMHTRAEWLDYPRATFEEALAVAANRVRQLGLVGEVTKEAPPPKLLIQETADAPEPITSQAKALWQLLDDIDSASDAIKPSDLEGYQRYYQKALELANLRHQYFVSDGYSLKPRVSAPEAEPPVPMLLHCPLCGARHIDDGQWAMHPHHTHACQKCGHTWRPAVVHTVGVQFLPGFKDTP